jgi:hypothetical protein
MSAAAINCKVKKAFIIKIIIKYSTWVDSDMQGYSFLLLPGKAVSLIYYTNLMKYVLLNSRNLKGLIYS